MANRYALTAVILGLALLVGCSGNTGGQRKSPTNPAGPDVSVVNDVKGGPGAAEGLPAGKKWSGSDPIVIRDCLVTVRYKQDAPAEHDGKVLEIAVVEGQEVKKGDLLAKLDDRLAAADVAIKRAKVASSTAEHEASIKTRDEAEKIAKRTEGLVAKKAESNDKLGIDLLTAERYRFEVVSKAEAINLSREELKQAVIVQKMYEIRSSTDGVVKQILKQPGEAVKNLETVFLIHNLDRVRVEGLMDIQYLSRLQSKKKLRAVIEYSKQEGPDMALVGHLQEVTAVAVTHDTQNPLIVSASDDGTVRVWDRTQRRERLILKHPGAVKSVACTGPAAMANLCLSGGTDGKARLWDLGTNSSQALRELQGGHKGTVTCVAFSPDGRSCVTAGEDKEICLWEVATGALRYKFPAMHRGAITSLQFPLADRVVSASRDNTLSVWQLGDDKVQLLRSPIPSRSGDVGVLGVSPDGQHVLFDQGRILRVLSLPEGRTEAVLQNSSGAANFTTFALFSPDGRLILTTGGSGGRLQLWRAPDRQTRGFEIRQLVSTDKSTCSAFAPDGSFLVTGTRDRQVLVWPVPTNKDEIDRLLQARVTLVEGDVQSSARQVRVWVELDNPNRVLPPGTTVTTVIYDE